ncbi:hypothetical protein LSAT2_005083 [Lamellibrachia satsuma]|nr:hypothetical protein LSAT2_005083 [Lamellibrachia satsuma]
MSVSLIRNFTVKHKQTLLIVESDAREMTRPKPNSSTLARDARAAKRDNFLVGNLRKVRCTYILKDVGRLSDETLQLKRDNAEQDAVLCHSIGVCFMR